MGQTLDTKQCAALLGISPASLETARCRRLEGYPPFYKIGRRVVYSRPEVERFMACRRVSK
jgi:hypothetical protein